MNLPMFKRLATDVAPPIAALLAFVARSGLSTPYWR